MIAKGCHDSQIAGHFAQEKTIEIVCRDFFWKGLTNWINDYVRSYDECQHNKSSRHARFGLLQPLQVPFAAWTSISTDFITQLPESQGRTQIMVVVDRFTKMAHFIGLEPNATAKDVANVFLREVWKLHGLPTEIISDMDAKFSGEFWESLCKSLNIKRRMSTAYHPQTDGQTERPTKYWKITYETLAIMIRTTGIKCGHWPSTHTTTQLPMHMECHPSTQTTVFICKQNG